MSLIKISAYYLIEAIEFLIIIRCILSWLPLGQNKFSEFIYMLTEPVLGPVRTLMQKTFGSMQIDFSPIIVFLLLGLIQRFVLML